MKFCLRTLIVSALMMSIPLDASKVEHKKIPDNLRRENLVPWCIVPFDAKKRTPAGRAKMLVRLGLKRSAYDWRAQHVQEFEEEILQYKKHQLFLAFPFEFLVSRYEQTQQFSVIP